jgi:hypothetical protein
MSLSALFISGIVIAANLLKPLRISCVSTALKKESDMSKRELIDTGSDKRYVRRDTQGQFKQSVDVGRSLSADKRHNAEHEAKPGEGDKGDHKSK